MALYIYIFFNVSFHALCLQFVNHLHYISDDGDRSFDDDFDKIDNSVS